jgi:hypothetical protein
VAFSLIFERYVTDLTLVDTAPMVADMTKEELYHAVAAHGFNVKIDSHEDNNQRARKKPLKPRQKSFTGPTAK